MPDAHFFKTGWGLHPILFHIGTVPVPTYTVTAILGILAALLLYRFTVRRSTVPKSGDTWLIPLLALCFGTLGAKAPTWIQAIFSPASISTIAALTSGKTIIGGLIGGWLGVVLAKRIISIRERRGNQFAPALALGLAFGRLGCLLQGCCYGIPTNLPWGVNFGDGVLRHPTQAYEILFHLSACAILLVSGAARKTGGLYLKAYFATYLVFRFLLEFIRIEPRVWVGLTGYQLAALVFVPVLLAAMRRESTGVPSQSSSTKEASQ